MNKLIKTFLYSLNNEMSTIIKVTKKHGNLETIVNRVNTYDMKMYEKFINIIKNNNYILNIIEKELYVNE